MFRISLIEPQAAYQLLQADDTVVLNATMDNPINGQVDVSDAWLPKARMFSLDGKGSDHTTGLPHSALSLNALGVYLAELGVESVNQPVVVYDNYGFFCAPRVAWQLAQAGLTQVCVLNGGLPHWLAQNFPTISANLPEVEGTHIGLSSVDEWVDKTALQYAIDNNTAQIVDARAKARFDGVAPEPRPGLRSGHMPKALNLPFGECLNEGKMKSKQQLEKVFEFAGVDISKPIITTCGSGVTACVVGLAAMQIGAQQVAVYDGSWAEWGSDPSCSVVTS